MDELNSISRERLARRLLAVILAESQGGDLADENFKALMRMPIADFWVDLADDVKARVMHEMAKDGRTTLEAKTARVLPFKKRG